MPEFIMTVPEADLDARAIGIDGYVTTCYDLDSWPCFGKLIDYAMTRRIPLGEAIQELVNAGLEVKGLTSLES